MGGGSVDFRCFTDEIVNLPSNLFQFGKHVFFVFLIPIKTSLIPEFFDFIIKSVFQGVNLRFDGVLRNLTIFESLDGLFGTHHYIFEEEEEEAQEQEKKSAWPSGGLFDLDKIQLI